MASHQRLAIFYNYHINVLRFWEDDSSQKAFPDYNIKSHRKSMFSNADATRYGYRVIIGIIKFI